MPTQNRGLARPSIAGRGSMDMAVLRRSTKFRGDYSSDTIMSIQRPAWEAAGSIYLSGPAAVRENGSTFEGARSRNADGAL